MKFDAEIMSVLTNFQTINPSMIFYEGNVLKVVSPEQDIIATADVSVTFPRQCAIWDMQKLLNILTMAKEADIEFMDNHLLIRWNRASIRFGYCSESLIIQPPAKRVVFTEKDAFVSFKMYPDVYTSVTKAMNILGREELAFRGADGKITLNAVNSDDKSADAFSLELGDTDKNFNIILDKKTLKLRAGLGYDVIISRKKYIQFASESTDDQANIVYIMAPKVKGSTLDD